MISVLNTFQVFKSIFFLWLDYYFSQNGSFEFVSEIKCATIIQVVLKYLFSICVNSMLVFLV